MAQPGPSALFGTRSDQGHIADVRRRLPVQSDVLRYVFEAVVRRCIAEGLVVGAGFDALTPRPMGDLSSSTHISNSALLQRRRQQVKDKSDTTAGV